MKIVYLTGYRYPASLSEPLTSGDLRFSFTLSRALAELGHDVQVITRREGEDAAEATLDGVTIHRYKSSLSRVFGTSFDMSWRRRKLFKTLTKDADLVICNSALSLEHTVSFTAPLIYVASGLEDVKNYSFSPKEILGFIAIKLLRDPLKRRTWKKAALVNTTAWHEDETLRKWGIPEQKIGTISSSIDRRRFFPHTETAALRKSLSLSENDRIILNVSRFTPAKGILETISAFEELNRADTKLILIGVHHSHDSSHYTDITTAIANSPQKNNIILLENIPEHELPVYYSLADVTSVFSKGYDPLPTTLIETMACGTPVVSTYYKTREQFIENGVTGLFIAEKNTKDWVEKVSQLLDNDSLRQSITEQALAHVQSSFDSQEIAKKFLRIVEHE